MYWTAQDDIQTFRKYPYYKQIKIKNSLADITVSDTTIKNNKNYYRNLNRPISTHHMYYTYEIEPQINRVK